MPGSVAIRHMCAYAYRPANQPFRSRTDWHSPRSERSRNGRTKSSTYAGLCASRKPRTSDNRISLEASEGELWGIMKRNRYAPLMVQGG
jgi:hypothetical protein